MCGALWALAYYDFVCGDCFWCGLIFCRLWTIQISLAWRVILGRCDG